MHLVSITPATRLTLALPTSASRRSSTGDGKPTATLTLTNSHDQAVAFRVQGTSPNGYSVKPVRDTLKPGQSQEVTVTLKSEGSKVSLDHFRIQAVAVKHTTHLCDAEWDDLPQDQIQSHELKVSVKRKDKCLDSSCVIAPLVKLLEPLVCCSSVAHGLRRLLAPTADVQSKSPSLDPENSRSTSVQKTPKVPGNVRRKQTPPMLILPPKTIIPPTPSTKERAPEMTRGSFLICVEKMFCGCATITVDQSTEFSVPQLSVSEAAVDGQAAEVAVEGEEVTGAAFSDDSRSTAASEDDRPPLVRFAQTARVPAALRELDVLKKSGVDPLALLDQASLDRLHRIGDKYSEGERSLQCDLNSFQVFEENKKLKNLAWGVSITKDNEFIQMASCDYDHEFLNGVAIRVEKDMCTDYESAKVIGPRSGNDATWQLVRNVAAVRARMDDISHESFVDALDEPMQAVFYASYSPLPGTTTVNGEPIPRVTEGCERAESLLNVGKLMPLRRGPDGLHGYRYTGYSRVRVPSSIAVALRAMPAFLLRRIMRAYWEGAVVDFDKFVANHKELPSRMETSPQADLYMHLRQRLTHKHHS